jgi:hypothetical protein
MRRVLLWHQVQTPAIMKFERRDETRHLPWGRLDFPDRSHQELSVSPVRACSLHMCSRNSWFCSLLAEHVGERAVSEPSLGRTNGMGRADGPAILSVPPPPAPAGGGGAVVATWARALQFEVSTAGAGGWGFLRMNAGQILPQ